MRLFCQFCILTSNPVCYAEMVDEIQMKQQDDPNANVFPLTKRGGWELVYAGDTAFQYEGYQRSSKGKSCTPKAKSNLEEEDEQEEDDDFFPQKYWAEEAEEEEGTDDEVVSNDDEEGTDDEVDTDDETEATDDEVEGDDEVEAADDDEENTNDDTIEATDDNEEEEADDERGVEEEGADDEVGDDGGCIAHFVSRHDGLFPCCTTIHIKGVFSDLCQHLTAGTSL